MTEDTTARPHLEDHEILHLVDRDASAWETDRWSKHVRGCEACARRLATLQRRSARFSEALAEVQLPGTWTRPPLPLAARRRRASFADPVARPWLRAAAALLLVLLPFAVVSPLRAWVAERVASGWSRVAAVLQGEPTPEPAPEPGREGSFTVRFVPASATLRIELDGWQAGGELVVRPAAGAEGTLEVLGGAEETPMISERGVRVGNSAASTASYDLGVPGAVQSVEVWVGAERVASVPYERLPATVELRGGERDP